MNGYYRLTGRRYWKWLKRLKWTIRLKGKRGHKGAREAMIGYGKQVMSGGLDKEMGDSRCMQDC